MTEDKIHDICRKYNIKNYRINNDMSIDVDGSVDLASEDLQQLPLTFNYINGNFYCELNYLESLHGAPNKVEGDFRCQYNDLRSFYDCPEYVGSSFHCKNNYIESLKYSPNFIGGSFICDFNELKSIKDIKCKPTRLYINSNRIKTLENFNFIHTKNIYHLNNPINEIWNLFVDNNSIDHFNELDIIQQNGRVVILDRLNYFLQDLGKKEVSKEDIKNYKVK